MRHAIPLMLVILIVGAGVAVACSPSSRSRVAAGKNSDAAFPLTVIDDAGRTVRFDKPPQRIISLSPGYTETLFALGAGERVVGVDAYSDYPAEAASRPKIGGAHSHNLEQMISLKPDLIVSLVEYNDVLDSLAARGISSLKLFPDDFEGVLHSILVLGKVTGTESRAQAINASMKERVERVRARVRDLPQPRVFFELDGTDPSRPFTVGPRSFIGDMIRVAGGRNIAEAIKTSSSQMSVEAIVAADPKIVVLGDTRNPINPQTREDVHRRAGWSAISAVRRDAIYPVDNAFFFRPGPRVVDGIETLARIFHPEVFH